MQSATPIETVLLAGAPRLLGLHARELPQRDDLCGAFCTALALGAAGVEEHRGEPVDQDAVALAAGSIVSALASPEILPRGEQGRRDYRLSIPSVRDAAVSGTTAAGLQRAVDQLSAGRLSALPFSGPWSAATLAGLFDVACTLTAPVTLVANFATRHLWGGRPSVHELLSYLLEGHGEGPPPDWDVGHFGCVFGCVRGPAGSLFCVADTYPSLGLGGVHLQPAERLAFALARPDMPAGGVIVVLDARDADAVRRGATARGLVEGLWDNGSITAEALT